MRSLFNVLLGTYPLKDMSVKTGSSDLVKAKDSPRDPRSKDLDGVPLYPTGIANAADERVEPRPIDYD